MNYPKINNYPFWRYALVDLKVAEPFVSAVWHIEDSNDYLLESVHVSYQEVGVAVPLAFTDVEAVLYDWSKSKETNNPPLPLMLITTPGRTPNIVGTGKLSYGAYKNSKRLNWMFYSNDSFEIRFSNHQGAAAPLHIQVMIRGRNIMKPGQFL